MTFCQPIFLMEVDKQGDMGSLTNAEKEVLLLLTEDFLTPQKIAIRRKCTRQAVFKILKTLKNKGAYDLGLRMVDKSLSTCQPCQPTFRMENKIRLHGQEFNIKILFKDGRYINALEKGANVLYTDGNTTRLFKDSIEIYSGQNFYAEDVQKATVKSFEYWNRFIARLEHDLKVILLKPRSQNIRLVNQHYAEINNELAKECEKKADKIRIFTNDDGKLWFLIDNSFNLHEAETVHPKTAQQDMTAVKAFFNDVRDNETVPLSKISVYMADTSHQLNELSHGLKAVVTFLQTQLPKDLEVQPIEKRLKPDYVG